MQSQSQVKGHKAPWNLLVYVHIQRGRITALVGGSHL
jgi:hypothetical protein